MIYTTRAPYIETVAFEKNHPIGYKYKGLVVSDVDGTLTDGRVLYNDDGSRGRLFSVIDGHGVKMLKDNGFAVMFVSGEDDKNIQYRAEKLGVFYEPARGRGKDDIVAEFLLFNNIYPKLFAIGDDVNDLSMLRMAHQAATPKGSILSERDELSYDILVLTKRGGNGAFREFAEMILLMNGVEPYKEYENGIGEI